MSSGSWKTTDVGATKPTPDNWAPARDWWQEKRAEDRAAAERQAASVKTERSKP
jgi:hypothetical protein